LQLKTYVSKEGDLAPLLIFLEGTEGLFPQKLCYFENMLFNDFISISAVTATFQGVEI